MFKILNRNLYHSDANSDNSDRAKGFTLVELLVVMAIIAILIALIIFAINASRMQSRNTQRRNTANTAKAALESYYSTYKYYPTASANLTTMLSPGGVLAPYATGMTAATAADPNGQSTRMCYSPNGTSRYWMRVQPEGNALAIPGACPVLTGTAVAPYEDFSVQ